MQTLDDDDALIGAAQAGDVGALEILLDRHHDRIRAVCARVVGSGADADDAAQMALIAIVRNLEKFDGRARFTTWSYRIATNAAIDELRRRSRRSAVSLDDPDAPRQVAAPGWPACEPCSRWSPHRPRRPRHKGRHVGQHDLANRLHGAGL